MKNIFKKIIPALLIAFVLLSVFSIVSISADNTGSDVGFKMSLDKITLSGNQQTLGLAFKNTTLEQNFDLGTDNIVIISGWCASTYGVADYKITLVDYGIPYSIDSVNLYQGQLLRDDIIQNCVNGGLNVDAGDLNGVYKFEIDLNRLIEENPQFDRSLTLLIEPQFYTNSTKTSTESVTAIRLQLTAPHLTCLSYEHTYDDSVYCTYCGDACTHGRFNGFNDLEIIKNDEKCYRHYEICDKCYQQLNETFISHQFDGSKCTACDYVCTHSEFVNGICSFCGFVCDHNMINRKCVTCGFECKTHNYTGEDPSLCVNCGECRHYNTMFMVNPGFTRNDKYCYSYIYYCTTCGDFVDGVDYYEHQFVDGYCRLCSWSESNCVHLWEIIDFYEYLHDSDICYVLYSKCAICNEVTAREHVNHSWNEGNICVRCNDHPSNSVCTHRYIFKECINSNYPDISCKQYIYICSICDKENVLYEEAHMFYNGICTVCNYESTCNHEIYNDFILVSSETVCYQIVSKCKLCNYFEIELDVEHKFENGNCINEECNVKCPHDYVDGVCSVCGLIEEVGTTETETDTETETETGFNFKISGSSLAKLGAVACVAFLLIVAFYFVDKNFGRKRR